MPEISDQDYRRFIALDQVATRYGGSADGIVKKVDELERDNAAQRGEIATWKGKAEAVPADALILTGDEKARYEAVKPVLAAHKPEEITAGLAERDKLRTTLAERDHADARRTFAEAVKWRLGVLENLKQFDGATFTVEEENGTGPDGKPAKVKVGYITPAGENQKAVRYDEFLKTLPEDVQKTLPADAAGSRAPDNRPTYTPPRVEGGGGAAAANGGVDAEIQANEKAATAPNALRPAKA